MRGRGNMIQNKTKKQIRPGGRKAGRESNASFFHWGGIGGHHATWEKINFFFLEWGNDAQPHQNVVLRKKPWP